MFWKAPNITNANSSKMPQYYPIPIPHPIVLLTSGLCLNLVLKFSKNLFANIFKSHPITFRQTKYNSQPEVKKSPQTPQSCGDRSCCQCCWRQLCKLSAVPCHHCYCSHTGITFGITLWGGEKLQPRVWAGDWFPIRARSPFKVTDTMALCQYSWTP